MNYRDKVGASSVGELIPTKIKVTLTHSQREQVLLPSHTSWQHTFCIVLRSTRICGSLQLHCLGQMGSGSSSVWISMALGSLHFSPYCTSLGAKSLVWSPTPCLGTTTSLKTVKQNSGRHYLRWMLHWTVPSSSQPKRSMILNSLVHLGHSSSTPWWTNSVSIKCMLLTLSDSWISQLYRTERNQCLRLVWLERILYFGHNSNPSAAYMAMIMKLYLMPQSPRVFTIWSRRKSTYATSGVNKCKLMKGIRP